MFVLAQLMPRGFAVVAIMPYAKQPKRRVAKSPEKRLKHKISPGILFLLYIS
jgi:hypothetical protein